MRHEFLIGVDIGTQGVKGVLFSVGGDCLATAFRPSQLQRPKPGVVEEDPEKQLDNICAVIKGCVRQARIAGDAIGCIGLTGQMAGVIGIDAAGRHATPYDSWLDTRCAPYIGFMQKKAGRTIIRKTGGPPSFNHGPKILWWKKERPRIYRAIRAFVQPGSYAAMRLCGFAAREAFIDPTYLHFSGFADNRRRVWDMSLCEAFGVDPEKLPRIVPSHAVVGEMSGVMAARCGLKSGPAVIAGCGDTAASFLSCGATQAGVCVDVAGTASVFAATTGRFLPDLKSGTLSCGQSAVPGLWHPYAYIQGGGMNLQWFLKKFLPRTSFAQMDTAAAHDEPRDDQPFFVPHMAGRVSPGWPRLRGAWSGLSWDHGPAQLYRAILEGVALEYGIYRDILRDLDPAFKIKELRVTGGGENNHAWNSIKAGVLGCPVVQMARREGAPMGAALLAGFGIGLFKTLPEAAQQWIGRGAVTKPRLGEKTCYARRLSRYRQLLQQLNQWSET
jgi:xylulokinase